MINNLLVIPDSRCLIPDSRFLVKCLLLAGASHAFQQLLGVPNLLVGGHFAIFQVDAAILVVEWADKEVDGAIGQPGDEFIH
jgi:hypothetical protein